MTDNKSVATIEPAPQPEPSTDGALILKMIDKLTERPDVSVETLERFFALHQKVQGEVAKRAYDAAFAEMQPHLPVIEKRGKSHNAFYAKWEDVVENVTPITGKYGFALSFRVSEDGTKVRVTCILSHKQGHREETSFSFNPDKSGSKNDIQAVGSSISYGKRYAAQAILNIVARDGLGADTDGNPPDALDTLDSGQVAVIKALIAKTQTDEAKFLQVARADSIPDILAKDFGRLVGLLKKKQAAQP